MVGKKCRFDTISTFSYYVILNLAIGYRYLAALRLYVKINVNNGENLQNLSFGRIEGQKTCVCTQMDLGQRHLYFSVLKCFSIFYIFRM